MNAPFFSWPSCSAAWRTFRRALMTLAPSSLSRPVREPALPMPGERTSLSRALSSSFSSCSCEGSLPALRAASAGASLNEACLTDWAASSAVDWTWEADGRSDLLVGRRGVRSEDMVVKVVDTVKEDGVGREREETRGQRTNAMASRDDDAVKVQITPNGAGLHIWVSRLGTRHSVRLR